MKKAFLVGINYPGTQNQLNGCINDVLLMNQVLAENFGFTDAANRKILTDGTATTANILSGLEWLVAGAQPGDVLYMHYSGHGSQVTDYDHDFNEEPDGLDEIICPIDLDWRRLIVTDDDFRKAFGKLPPGVNVTVVLDCCHSGQGLREFVNPYQAAPSPNRHRFQQCPPEVAAVTQVLDLQVRSRALQGVKVIEEQKGVLISGCASNQTSADAWIHNKYNGACTFYMVETLRDSGWQIQHDQLVDIMNQKMDRYGYAQNPELNCAGTYVGGKFLI